MLPIDCCSKQWHMSFLEIELESQKGWSLNEHKVLATSTTDDSKSLHMISYGSQLVINPRRACAARVTVLGLCVCLSVCLLLNISLFT